MTIVFPQFTCDENEFNFRGSDFICRIAVLLTVSTPAADHDAIALRLWKNYSFPISLMFTVSAICMAGYTLPSLLKFTISLAFIFAAITNFIAVIGSSKNW